MAMMQMNHFKVTFIYFLIIMFLSGCDVENDSIKSLSENSIIYCAEGSPETFNPQLVTSGTTIDATSNQLYDRLLTYTGNDNTLTPALAKSWHVTENGKKVTFYLRKDVQFHTTNYFTPSRLMNADDVIFSFNRIIQSDHPYHVTSGGNYPFFQNIGLKELVTKIEKINDHTVRFNLKHADNSFLPNLATDYAVILSAEYADNMIKQESKASVDTHPIGTGPFVLKEYRVGSFIRYYRHEQYWRNPAQIELLVYDITPSNTGRLTKLLARECDVTAYPIAHEKINENNNLRLESLTAMNVGYFGFNVKKPPFNNKLVRQAISYGINKKTLLDTVYQGKAEPAKSIIPNTSWAFDDSIPEHEFNPLIAKELLKKAGYPEGFSMDLWAMPVQRPYNPNAITMAKLIQADLFNIGINVKIVSYEWNTFLNRLSDGQHQSFLLGWSADHPEPDNFFSPILSCSASENGSNTTFWCNKEYDELIHQSLKTTDVNKRKQNYSKAMKILYQELPLIPIAHSKHYQARNKNITGDILAPFGGVNFYQVDKQKAPKKNKKTFTRKNIKSDDGDEN